MEARQFSSPEDAEKAFYEALAKRDRGLLRNVWVDNAEAVLIKASGEMVTQGDKVIADIADGFGDRGALIFRFENQQYRQDGNTAVHCHEESIYVEGDRRRQSHAIATNIFVLGETGWKLFFRQITAGQVRKVPTVERRELPSSLVKNLGVLDLLK